MDDQLDLFKTNGSSPPSTAAVPAPWPVRLTAIEHRGRVVVEPPREPDVLQLVPPRPDVEYLNRVFEIDAHTSPLVMLQLWHPTDPIEQSIRSYLIAFGRSVLAAEAHNRAGRRR